MARHLDVFEGSSSRRKRAASTPARRARRQGSERCETHGPGGAKEEKSARTQPQVLQCVWVFAWVRGDRVPGGAVSMNETSNDPKNKIQELIDYQINPAVAG